jgi:excisionase family DNA binding protein
MAKIKPKFISVKGAAALTGASAKYIYYHFANGDLPGRKVGRKIFFSEAILTRFLESKADRPAKQKEETANDE